VSHFQRHIGIDYSGARTPDSRLAALQVYSSESGLPQRVSPPSAPQGRFRNWTRREVAQWLIDLTHSKTRFIAGIDHGLSFPIDYFKRYGLSTWQQFLDDFSTHWPTDQTHQTIDFLRKRSDGPPVRFGSNCDFRLTETWTSSAKSVFQFDVQGSVAKSTHAGLPWIRTIRRAVGNSIHFWPFDGWQIQSGASVIVEVFPSVFRNRYPRQDRTVDQQDAYAVSRWLAECDKDEFLQRYLDPPLTNLQREIADLEGWILGIL
jgi:hypothetical protein